MSLIGAMNTAVSGLTAQSAAFTNISDNVANSQTIGYKGVSTAFADYLTSSTPTQNMSGAVETTPQYLNDLQGTITQSTNPLALAISGAGFFNVSQLSGSGSNNFSTTQYYTRCGDFSLNDLGYLVNGSGGYLDGYNIDPNSGQIQTGNLQPINVDTAPLPAVQTSSISYAADLPNVASGGAATSQVNIFDSAGAAHVMSLDWSQSTTTPNQWTLSFASPDMNNGASFGSATVMFNPNGTMSSFSGDGTLVQPGTTDSTLGEPVALTLSPTINGQTQNIRLSLGNIGTTSGVNVGSTSSYNLKNLSADGRKVGNYTGISMTSGGDVVASYDNSQTRVVAHIPISTFKAADALQRQNGQMFTATQNSGSATLSNANENGTGQLVTGSVESSNVDIATDLTKLISAQQAYGANAKMVTAADQMMQTTLQMKQ